MSEKMREYVEKDADENSYYVCPDPDLYEDLLEGLVENQERYGYPSCPCRQASGLKTYDADIICPCEYRDADVDEFGMCYCGLFVSEEVSEEPDKLEPIPERRPPEILEAAMDAEEEPELEEGEDIPVWRCKVCGYLAAREGPPPICPICKAKADRFERFNFSTG